MTDQATRRGFLAATAAAGLVVRPGRRLRAAALEARTQQKRLRAGAAAVDITPRKLPVIINGGVAERTADRVVDPLHARCLVLHDGAVQIALAVVDSCMMPRGLLDEAKRRAQAATGIPAERMLISATHTHSAPAVAGVLGSDVEQHEARLLPGRIAQAIASAQENLAPARIGWAVGKDPKNVFCRRYLMKPGTAQTNRFSGTRNDRAQMNPGYLNPNAVKRLGPVDTDVTVLSVQTPQGRPLALLANYSTHYAGSPPVSADYFGVFCRRMKGLLRAEDVSPPFVAMLSNGTSGDANCCDFDHAQRKFDRFTVAEDVAQVAWEASRGITYHDWLPVVMREKLLRLQVRMPSQEEVAEARQFMQTFAGRKPRTWEEVYARETLLLSQLPPTRELKLQAVRMGGLGITAIPNEVYGVTGLKIKRSSPLQPTFNISLANGCEGYVPPPEQFELGGYTTWRARSSCLEIQAEAKITATLLGLLRAVARERCEQKPVPSA